jgi:hypothetical protein
VRPHLSIYNDIVYETGISFYHGEQMFDIHKFGPGQETIALAKNILGLVEKYSS